jgi:hypothetical protein
MLIVSGVSGLLVASAAGAAAAGGAFSSTDLPSPVEHLSATSTSVPSTTAAPGATVSVDAPHGDRRGEVSTTSSTSTVAPAAPEATSTSIDDHGGDRAHATDDHDGEDHGGDDQGGHESDGHDGDDHGADVTAPAAPAGDSSTSTSTWVEPAAGTSTVDDHHDGEHEGDDSGRDHEDDHSGHEAGDD